MRAHVYVLSIGLGLGGCATTSSTECKPLAQAPDSGDGFGRIDPGIISHIKGATLLDHVKVGVGADGTFHDVAIYHNDPSPITAAVKDAVGKQFPQSKLVNYETEWEHGLGLVTEVNLLDGKGRACEMSAKDDGTVLYTECVVERGAIPPDVVHAVKNALPDGQWVTAELRDDKRGNVYKIEVQQGAGNHVLHIDPQGKLLAHLVKIKAELRIAL